MKASLTLLLIFCVGSSTSRGDIGLGGPGVTPGAQVATKVPFKISLDLTNIYKFVFAGIQAKGNTAGAPGSSGTNGNGGQFHVSATVSDVASNKVKSGKIEFRDIQEFNAAPLKTLLNNPSETYLATTSPITITIEWKGEGNAHKPDGIFNILGEYKKDPFPPTGSLNFAVGDWMLQAASGGDVTPDGTATVVRE